jgi:pimeloyl-ACP methyl ester carboxylesterase
MTKGKPSRPSKPRVRVRSSERTAAGDGAPPRGYQLRDDEVERSLLTGESAHLLEPYFGEAGYQQVRELARQAAARSARGGPRVLILPGIMGSKLGTPGRFLDDIIWIDPFDIARGKLAELALQPGLVKHTALGVVLFAYLRLKLTLKLNGFDAHFYPFDWRLSIADLGAQLAESVKRDETNGVSLVAHSMGGLVARAALTHKLPEVKRLVMLGTPNFGSFVPVQAVRAVYPVVRQVGLVDLVHSPETLAEKVFGTFPGLYQMLPHPERFSAIDLSNPAVWPKTGPRPNTALLPEFGRIGKALATADDRFILIAGVNQETTTGLRVDGSDFIYEQSLEGDGTVPLAFAELPGATTYYVEESHGSLPNNGTVERAVIELLRSGRTAVLPDHWAPARRGVTRVLRDADFPVPAADGRRGTELTPSEVRHLADELVSPDARDIGAVAGIRAPAAASYDRELKEVVVARRRQHRVDLKLACGSIADVEAPAYVLGVFRDVEPTGAASALDERLDGAISEFTKRRMFDGNVGEVFIIPTGRHLVRSDIVLFAGLGSFDRFDGGVQRLAAENVVRTFIRTGVPEFATVLLGTGSGRDLASTLENLLRGFFRAICDLDSNNVLRAITFCELDRDVYTAMKEELYRLASTSLFDEIEATFSEVPVLATVAPLKPERAVERGPAPTYLIVRQEPLARDPGKERARDEDIRQFSSSLLTAGAKASVITGVKRVRDRDLSARLSQIESKQFTFEGLRTFGAKLAKLVVGSEVLDVLPTMKDRHLVIVHDAAASRIPWETLCVDDWFPATGAGLSRRYLADNFSVAKWLEQRKQGAVLNVLLIINPTLNLDGAEKEGKRLRELLGKYPSVKVDELHGAEATKAVVLQKLRSGEYDLAHYAGHASFDPGNPALGGLQCHDHVLTGTDLAGAGRLPSLVFFNACESGRVRGARQRRDPQLVVSKRIERAAGVAEALMRGGIANYIGTYWSVGDASATAFADAFYSNLLGGKSIGAALLAGRKMLCEEASADWADFILYGSYDFVLKQSAV